MIYGHLFENVTVAITEHITKKGRQWLKATIYGRLSNKSCFCVSQSRNLALLPILLDVVGRFLNLIVGACAGHSGFSYALRRWRKLDGGPVVNEARLSDEDGRSTKRREGVYANGISMYTAVTGVQEQSEQITQARAPKI